MRSDPQALFGLSLWAAQREASAEGALGQISHDGHPTQASFASPFAEELKGAWRPVPRPLAPL